MDTGTIEKLINAGFVEKKDCVGHVYYSHPGEFGMSIVVYDHCSQWLVDMKLKAAISINAEKANR